MAETTVEITEEDVRAAVDRICAALPSVSGEDIVEQVMSVMKGELLLKDLQGLSDDAMESVYTLAYNAFRAGNFDEAHKLFVFLCTFDHLTQKYWIGLGACRFGMENYEGAVEAYSMAAFADTEDPRPPLRAADCHLALGNTDQATLALTAAIEISGTDPKHAESKQRAQALLDLLTREQAKHEDAPK